MSQWTLSRNRPTHAEIFRRLRFTGKKYEEGDDPKVCDLCHRKALYKAKTTGGVTVAACAEHRSICSDAMLRSVARVDMRYNAAQAALGRGHNVEPSRTPIKPRVVVK